MNNVRQRSSRHRVGLCKAADTSVTVQLSSARGLPGLARAALGERSLWQLHHLPKAGMNMLALVGLETELTSGTETAAPR
jgi:hypothetical protein